MNLVKKKLYTVIIMLLLVAGVIVAWRFILYPLYPIIDDNVFDRTPEEQLLFEADHYLYKTMRWCGKSCAIKLFIKRLEDDPLVEKATLASDGSTIWIEFISGEEVGFVANY